MSSHRAVRAAASQAAAPESPPRLSLSGCSSLFSLPSTSAAAGGGGGGGGGGPMSPVSFGIAPVGGGGGGEEAERDGSCWSGDGADRRTARRMKNRESALRSRARKRAYVEELEIEVTRLVDENSNLKRQCNELKLAVAAQVLSPKSSLRRTTSAQF